jgi:hypothetical protein
VLTAAPPSERAKPRRPPRPPHPHPPHEQEGDFHGLKALLHTYLDGDAYDSSGLADTVIAQARALPRCVGCRHPRVLCWLCTRTHTRPSSPTLCFRAPRRA